MSGTCEICGGYCDRLEKHHVFGGCRRQTSDKYGAVMYLCHGCHHDVTDENIDTKRLKSMKQREIMAANGWSINDFIRVFGRNYL